MKKSIIFAAVLSLGFLFTLAAPPKANAGVVVGVQIGPVVPRPYYGYGYGYVGVPRPYVAYPYGYAPVYVQRPYYGYYGRYDRYRYHVAPRWNNRGRDHGYRDRGYYRGRR